MSSGRRRRRSRFPNEVDEEKACREWWSVEGEWRVVEFRSSSASVVQSS